VTARTAILGLRRVARDVDALLRGRLTRREELAAGNIAVPVRTLLWGCLALGASYGLFMGLYAATMGSGLAWLAVPAAMAKVPLLFLLTLAITFPSLYVFSALLDCRLRPLETLKLLLGAVAVNLAVVASLGPVTGFFTLSTTSYPFMVLLNVAFFAAGGVAGLRLLHGALRDVFSDGEAKDGDASGTDEAVERERLVFHTWIVIYCLVGAQMAWILRPFIGSPDLPFALFRPRSSNFFEAVMRAVRMLLP